MFSHLSPGKADPILSLTAACLADPRPHKMDLAVGVYRDEQGQTPVMQAVSEAESRLLTEQTSKSYVGIVGNHAFNDAMLDMLIGPLSGLRSRCRAIQTPGASGALRMLADLIAKANPNATVWLSDPSYVNHAPIMQAAGLQVAYYRYFDTNSKHVNEAQMLEDLQALKTGDVLLLHACCHNPSGADLSVDAWGTLADLVCSKGVTPFVDVAYQGFAQGMERDVAGLRLLLDRVPEALVVASCSKHFGLYRERTGVAVVMGEGAPQVDCALSQLMQIARASYTMPPDHGASLVAMIWQDEAHLRPLWLGELDRMRSRIQSLRHALSQALAARSGEQHFDFITQHQGMFSLLGISADTAWRLREHHAIYVVDSGRINIAGLRQATIEPLADALINELHPPSV